MGILERMKHHPHHEEHVGERAAIAHDEAADAFSPEVEKKREDAARAAQAEEDREAAEFMTYEGDPWG